MAKFFGGSGNQFAIRGERQAIPVSSQANGSLSYETGYGVNYSKDLTKDVAALRMERKLFNQLFYELTDTIGKLQRQGAWDWEKDVTYPRGAQVYYNNDMWMAKQANTNSTPAVGNDNWFRQVELFEQVGVTNVVTVTDGSKVTAPIKGKGVVVSGYWKVREQRIDRSSSFDVAVNGIHKSMNKTGDRGGSKGHSYSSNFYFAFSHVYMLNFNKNDTLSINVVHDNVDEHELCLTFLG